MSETLLPTGYDTHTTPKGDLREALDLPVGFETEKGSLYQYTPDGKPERWKYDGTHHEPLGITVFIEGTSENLDTMTRVGASQSHLPPEMQKKPTLLNWAKIVAGAEYLIYQKLKILVRCSLC